jgi:hypothetical protein
MDDNPGGPKVQHSHQSDLVFFLFTISLIDANSINPKTSGLIRKSEAPQSVRAIACYPKERSCIRPVSVATINELSGGWIAPGVRQSFVIEAQVPFALRPLIDECQMLDDAYNRVTGVTGHQGEESSYLAVSIQGTILEIIGHFCDEVQLHENG